MTTALSGDARGGAPNHAPSRVPRLGLGRHWAWPASVAAVVVASAVLVPRLLGNSPAHAPAVSQDGSMPRVVLAEGMNPASLAVVRGPAQAGGASGALLRDAQLDRYLAAHKQFAGTSALGVPSAYLRSATVSSDVR